MLSLLCLCLFTWNALSYDVRWFNGTTQSSETDQPVKILNGSLAASPNPTAYTFACGVYEPRIPISPRDFYLNAIILLKQLALKTPSETATEAPKVINNAEAQSVTLTIGGGQHGQDRMLRARMAYILFATMERIPTYGFDKLKCLFFHQGGQDVIATLTAEPSPSNGQPSNGSATVSRVSKRDERDVTISGVNETQEALDALPRLETTYVDNVELDLPGFYCSIGAGIDALARADKSEAIYELELTRPGFPVTGRVRGVNTPRPWRLLTARDIIDSLYLLLQDTLHRIDTQGKTYSAMTAIIFATDYDEPKIGAITLQKRRTALAASENVTFS